MEHRQIIILIAFCLNKKISIFIWSNLLIQTKVRKNNGLMAFPQRDSLSRILVFSRSNKRRALHNSSLQCKQLRPKSLNSTTHLLTKASTHVFMYSCISQNFAVCITIFSPKWWGNSLHWNGKAHRALFLLKVWE